MTEARILSKYIKIAITTLCVVCFLVACDTQVVNEENLIGKVAIKTTSISRIPVESENIVESIPDESTEEASAENSETEQEYITYFTEEDVADIAKVLLRECGGVSSKTEQACVAWCILNRVDESGDSIYGVLRASNQFAFSESEEIREDLYELAKDVLWRWNNEKNGISDSGRVLPHEYIYFYGDGMHNYFRNAFSGSYDIWDYSLESPYEN